MNILQKRVEKIEQSEIAQSAARIAHAQATGDLSGLTDAELLERIAEIKREILAHPAEWRAQCDALAERIGEEAAAALREMRFEDLDTATLNILAGVENAKLDQAA